MLYHSAGITWNNFEQISNIALLFRLLTLNMMLWTIRICWVDSYKLQKKRFYRTFLGVFIFYSVGEDGSA